MTIVYREAFGIAGLRMGIEELEDGFRLWLGGSAIGHSESIEGARSLLATYIGQKLHIELKYHEERVALVREELRSLDWHPAGILHFLTSYETPEEG